MARIGSSGNGGDNPNIVPEVLSDPVTPTPGQMWVLHSGVVGSPIGLLLALTQAKDIYYLSYRTTEGTTVRIQLS